MAPLGLRFALLALVAASGCVEAAQRKANTKRPSCAFDGSAFKLSNPSTADIPSTDAWAPRGNRIVLTNDCKYWLNSSCAIVQQINGCDDANSCTKDRCKTPDPQTCTPFPKCAFYPAQCTYEKTCDSDSTKGVANLDGNTGMPAPKAACQWVPEKGKFRRVEKWSFWYKLGSSNAWAPAKGGRARTGDCKYILDDQCNILHSTGGCDDGNPCTQDTCVWNGNLNTPWSCRPFPTCFYRSGICTFKPIQGCTSPGRQTKSSPPKNSPSPSPSPSPKHSRSPKPSSGSNGGPLPAASAAPPSTGQDYNVLFAGAKGDGSTWDTGAIQATMDAACAAGRADGGAKKVVFPGGYTFRTGPITVDPTTGGCGNGGLIVQIDGTVLGADDCGSYNGKSQGLAAVFVFGHMKNLYVTGSGTIDGSGDKWWSGANSCSKPQGLSIRYCDTCSVTGITIRHPGQMHLMYHVANDILVDGVTTDSPADSPNTDSLHFEWTTRGTIRNCILTGGDDAMSIVSGCTGLVVDNITATETHGFSIGSLGKFGMDGCVSDISFSNLDISGALNAVRIKTYDGGRGSVSGISFTNVKISNVARPITIDQYYCNGDYKLHCTAGKSQSIAIKDITFNNIYGTMDPTSNSPAIYMDCSDLTGCDNVQMGGISITGNKVGNVANNVVVKTTSDVSPGLPSTMGSISGSQNDFATSMRSICPF